MNHQPPILTTVLALLVAAGSAWAATNEAASFTGGGGTATGGVYELTASLGLIGGESSGGPYKNTGTDPGAVPAVKSLLLAATPATINQGATSQLTGTAVLDDDSLTPLIAQEITWGPVLYPFSAIDSNGVLTAVADVYSAASGTVNGFYQGASGYTSIGVRGPYVASGIPDSWFIQYFGPAPNPAAAPEADPTGSGQNNLFKYMARLDPTNATARFQLRIEPVSGQPTQKRLVFSPRWDDRSYTVQFRTNLVGGATWTNVVNTATTDAGLERSVIDLDADNRSRFYRIQISLP